MTPIEKFFDALRSRGIDVSARPNRSGWWVCKCPSHNDIGPSLNFKESEGVVVLKCLGNCETVQVLEALGLSFADLFPEKEKGARRGRKATGKRTTKKGQAAVSDRVLPDVPEDVKEFLSRPKVEFDGEPIYNWKKPTKTYTYKDEDGRRVLCSNRFETHRHFITGKDDAGEEWAFEGDFDRRSKTFSQVRFAPNGWKIAQLGAGWYELKNKVWLHSGMTDPDNPPSGGAEWFDDCRRVLYHLPQLLKAAADGGRTCYVVEGEKDVETLERIGFVATCNPMGAGKWRPEFNMAFDGFQTVVIWVDRDGPGYKHALTVRENLLPMVSDIRIVEGRAGKDATDHIEAGLTTDQYRELTVDDVDGRLSFLSSLPVPLPGADKADTSPGGGSATDKGVSGPSEGQDGANDIGGGPPGQNSDLSLSGGRGGNWHLRNEYAFTDVGNAERLANYFDGDVLYCHAQERWFVWDGIRYQPDIDGGAKITQGIYDMSRRICEGLSGKDKRGLAHFKKLESTAGISATTAVLKHIPGIAVRTDDLDTRLDIIPCLNGVIDLRSGELMPGQKEMLCTRQIPVTFVKDAECPKWIEFLDMVLPDEESQRFLWQWFGYTLTGYTSEQMMLFIYGVAGSGKSTVVDILSNLMGEYYETIHRKHIMSKKMENDEIPQWLAKLKGCRYVTAVETQDHDRIDASMIKQMTGEKQITARFMAKNDFRFQPQFKLVVTGNFRFGIDGDDIGVWRRIADLTFNNPIPEEKKVLDFSDMVWREEKEGILQWALAGAQSWFKNRLTIGPKMRARVSEYRSEQDVLGAFVNERLEVIEGAQIASTDLYEAFTKWAKTNREYAMSHTKFSTKMKAKFDSKRDGSSVKYFGIRLAPETVEMGAGLV